MSWGRDKALLKVMSIRVVKLGHCYLIKTITAKRKTAHVWKEFSCGKTFTANAVNPVGTCAS